MPVTITSCTCTHDFQDSIFGPGQRVHNIGKEGRPICTVCGKKKEATKKTSDMAADEKSGKKKKGKARNNG